MHTKLCQGKKGQLTGAAVGAITTVVRLEETMEVIAVRISPVGGSSVRRAVVPLAAGVALVGAGPAAASTSSEILTPATAVTISSGALPAAGRLAVGRSPEDDVFRTLLGFDAPALDPADITDATLVLTEAECVDGDVAAYRTTSAWDGLVAWSSQPDVDLEHPAPGRREGSCPGPSVTFDLTDEVRAWLDGAPEGFGLEIRGDETADLVRLFDGEGGTPPYLVLAFADETPPPPDPDPGPGSDGTGDLYPAVVSAQLSDAPATTDGDGSLRVGRSGGGERERVLLDFGLPAIDVDELWNATLVLRETGCDPAAAPVVASSCRRLRLGGRGRPVRLGCPLVPVLVRLGRAGSAAAEP